MNEDNILKMAALFEVEQGAMQAEPYGRGHINDTYRITIAAKDGRRRYLMQRINNRIFSDPDKLMENIVRVTQYLREKILARGGDPERETLTTIPAVRGGMTVRDEEGGVYRMYRFIEGTITVDLPDTTELFELSGEAFGQFQRELAGFPAQVLGETIPDFHHTPMRYAQLCDAIRRDALGRAEQVQAEIAFCRSREAELSVLLDALKAGEIPLRVTHNDTKLNNVLLDAETGRGVCVIDLDTVMPGLAAYDFGDSIRSGANTANEDERDLSRVSLSLPMFRAFTRGFLRGTGGALGRREIELLPMGAKLMTLECGMRFLADHLNGDCYFKIHRPGHNLDRARVQFALVRSMEANMREMERIVLEEAARSE